MKYLSANCLNCSPACSSVVFLSIWQSNRNFLTHFCSLTKFSPFGNLFLLPAKRGSLFWDYFHFGLSFHGNSASWRSRWKLWRENTLVFLQLCGPCVKNIKDSLFNMKPYATQTVKNKRNCWNQMCILLWLCLFLKISRVFQKYRWPLKVQDFFIGKNTEKQPYHFFLRVAEAFCTRTYQSHFWTHYTCAKDRSMQICFWNCSVRAWKTRSRWSFSTVSQREHCICRDASRIDLRNQGAIHVRGEAQLSLLITHLQNHFELKWDVSKHWKKGYYEKWPSVNVNEKGDTCMNPEVRSTGVKWLDWCTVQRDRQTNVLCCTDP